MTDQEYWDGGDSSRWQNRGHGTQSPIPISTSIFCVSNQTQTQNCSTEQFSLKNSWKLAERLLNNQDHKKNPQVLE